MSESTAGRPIRPDEVGDAQSGFFPPEVFSVFNRLIAAKFVNGRAVVRQDDAVAGVIAALNCERHVVFDRGYLNVEEAYRAVGWHVSYDKPGYNEEYPAVFEFSRGAPL